MAKANKLFSSSDEHTLYFQKPAQWSDTSMLQVARMRNSNTLTLGNTTINGSSGKAKVMGNSRAISVLPTMPMFQMAGKGNPISISEESMAKAKKALGQTISTTS
eukprot:15355052-Ditylum_brightwellii.AAC.1